MYKEHSIFNLPDDKNEIIFRYFKFEHFKDLIESSELYLSALSEMSDKHEGTIPERIVKVWYENALKEKGKDFANAMLKVWKPTERDKKENFISSWCLNNSESFAMWKIYTKNRDAIAIKTKISNFNTAITN